MQNGLPSLENVVKMNQQASALVSVGVWVRVWHICILVCTQDGVAMATREQCMSREEAGEKKVGGEVVSESVQIPPFPPHSWEMYSRLTYNTFIDKHVHSWCNKLSKYHQMEMTQRLHLSAIYSGSVLIMQWTRLKCTTGCSLHCSPPSLFFCHSLLLPALWSLKLLSFLHLC